MKKFKKLTALLLTGSLILTLLSGCGNQEDSSTSNQEERVIKMGFLGNPEESTEEVNEQIGNMSKEVAGENASKKQAIYFASLDDMLTGLEDGEIDIASMSKVTADYITAKNSKFATVSTEGRFGVTVDQAFCMATTKDNQEICDMLSDTIKKFKENGKMDELMAVEDSQTLKLPEFEDAKTITVALAGDCPPIDGIDEDGNPVGFSMAFLSAISEELQINIEVTQIKAWERMDTLSSGQADVIFLTMASEVTDDNGKTYLKSSDSEDILLTEPYCTSTQTFLRIATSE